MVEWSKDIHTAALVVETIWNGRTVKILFVCAIVVTIIVGLKSRDDGYRHSPVWFVL